MIEAIENAITNSVEPEGWKPNGGVGTITANGGQLVILQTPENHKVIADAIEQLRKVRGPQVEVAGSIAMQNATGKSGTYSGSTNGNLNINGNTTNGNLSIRGGMSSGASFPLT